MLKLLTKDDHRLEGNSIMMTMTGWIAIALGGALGALSRFAMSHQVYQWFGRDFAWGTLSVNVIGSFFMGLLALLFVEKVGLSTELRAFILIGFLGSFTTFSTFSYETMQYLEVGEISKALANIVVSVLICVIAVWLGMLAAKQL
jgi:CrcB protein